MRQFALHSDWRKFERRKLRQNLKPPPPLHRAALELEEICEERRQLKEQRRLHFWLHGWLFVHAPISFLLLLLVFWHAFVTLFYY